MDAKILVTTSFIIHIRLDRGVFSMNKQNNNYDNLAC